MSGFSRAVAEAGGILVALEDDPVAAVWPDRPAPPAAPIRLQPADLAGEDAAAKVARVQAEMTREKVDIALISDPHAVAWLFNIRGGRAQHAHSARLGYRAGGGDAFLFLRAGQAPEEVAEALAPVCRLLPREALEDALPACVRATGAA